VSLTLYYHPLSSYCWKVLIALHENATAFDRRIIDLGNDKDRTELLAMWPLLKFPVIRDSARGRELAESTIIIEYLDHYFPGKGRLIPENWEDALQARLWDRFFDNYLQGPMQRIVGNQLQGGKGDVGRERATLQTAYGMIDGHVRSKGWIAGEFFSVADCAAAPALFYTSTLQEVPGTFQNLKDYFGRLMERPSVKRVLEEARPYFPMYPFAEAIPKQFR
jgi:glutathione S-transferase